MSSRNLSRSLQRSSMQFTGDILTSTTECALLSKETEDAVTAAVEALQHILERTSSRGAGGDTNGPSVDERTDSDNATEYLMHFSYGLTPGEARWIVYRFLLSQNMNIPHALEDLMRSAEFRKKQNLDKMVLFPCLISMSGYDQASMCEELRIPFIHNLTSGKRYIDAEGRLRLEEEQLDYYNVPYEELYGSLAHANAQGLTSSSNTPHMPDGVQLPMFSEEKRRTAAAAARNKSPSKRRGTEEDGALTAALSSQNLNDHVRRYDSSNSVHSDIDGGRRKDSGAEPQTGLWRSIVSFHWLGHIRDAEKPPPDRTLTRQPSYGSNSPDHRRHGRSRSRQSADSDTYSTLNEQNDENASTATEVPVLLHREIAEEALSDSPQNRYADSLNFHGILQPIVEVITRHVPFAFHYWDREGHPIMYCRLGGLNSKKLMRDLFAITPIDAEPRTLAMLFNMYALSVLSQLIRFCNRKNCESNRIHDALLTHHVRGRRYGSSAHPPSSLFRSKPLIDSCVIVVDCAGMRLRRYFYKPLLLMVKSIVSANIHHHPNMMHHTYVTNCKPAINWSYLMIRGMLSEETRQRVTFCSPHNTAATLAGVISSEFIPEELGGKCQCPGGCIPSIAAALPGSLARQRRTSSSQTGAFSNGTSVQSDTSSMDHTMNAFSAHGLIFQPLHCTVERLNLGPHVRRQLSFAMEAHTEIIWEFMAKNKQRVTFAVLFVSAADDGVMLSLVPRRRVQSDAGHYICPTLGTVIFEWSNRRSYFRHCRVNLKVYREERTVAAMAS